MDSGKTQHGNANPKNRPSIAPSISPTPHDWKESSLPRKENDKQKEPKSVPALLRIWEKFGKTGAAE